MGQLLKITSVPFESVKISQGGKFVSSDQVDAERRRALRRSMSTAMQTHHSSTPYVNKVNQAYSTSEKAVQMESAIKKTSSASVQPKAVAPATAPAAGQAGAAVAEAATIPTETVSAAAETAAANANISQESNASYLQERGSLEMRVQRGDLSFLPPLSMTIVTQRPEVKIEYTGDFHYFPEPPHNPGSNLNIET